MEYLEVKEVSHHYKDTNGSAFCALDKISFRWEEKISIAVIGESGSGKSTLGRILAGFEKPSQGTVFINKQDTRFWSLKKWKAHRKDIQAVFQDASGTLNPARSTYHNVEEALCNLTDLSAKERKKRVYALMELVHLRKGLLDIPVKYLSGGEQRRLALLRALSVQPKFLILDEVTAGLDLLSAEAVLQLLETYHKEYGCTYLFITHNMQTAYRMTKHIYEIKQGKIIRDATPALSAENY